MPPPVGGVKGAAETVRATKSPRDATEKYHDTLDDLNEMLQAGAIDMETYHRAVAQANDELSKTDPLAKAAGDVGDALGNAAQKAMTQWKGFGDLIQSIEQDLEKMLMKDLVTQPLENWFKGEVGSMIGGGNGGSSGSSSGGSGGSGFGGGGLFGGLFSGLFGSGAASVPWDSGLSADDLGLWDAGEAESAGASMGGDGLFSFLGSLFHTGGVVGIDSVPSRSMASSFFIGAPRLHDGGYLAPDEVPAILRKGETVLPVGQSPSGGLTVNMTVNSPDVSGFRASQAQITAGIATAMRNAQRNL